MPRRPRPDYRTAPLGTKYSSKTKSLGTTTSNLPRPTRHNIQEPESDSDGSQGDLTRDVHSGKYQIFDTSCGSEDLGEAEASVIEQEEEEYDPDQARVTQWVDEEELVGSDGSEGDVLKGPITPRRADYSDLQLVCHPLVAFVLNGYSPMQHFRSRYKQVFVIFLWYKAT